MLYFDLVSRIIIDERVLKKKEEKETEERKNAEEKLIALCKEKGWSVLIRKAQYINVGHKFEEITK